jgi:RNA polymerase-binding transcription factor
MPAGFPDESTETASGNSDATARRLVAELESATGNVRRLEDEYEAVLADPAVIQEDRDATRILLEGARDAAAAAERAVERHRAGTYGRCARCGHEIPAERLEALPEADTCVSCS